MPGIVTNSLGKIVVSEETIAILAGYTAIENYGIVGMAAKSAGDGLAELLKRENLRKGVKVSTADNAVIIDLFVIIQYGVSIGVVAQNVIDNVAYRVREITGLEIAAVNVYVEGVHV